MQATTAAQSSLTNIDQDTGDGETVQIGQPGIDNLVSEDIEEQRTAGQLADECNKHAFSDGTYYKIDMERSSLEGRLFGVCQLCTHNQTICGSFKSPTNFATHIKRKHPNKYEEFLNHKKSKQKPKDRDREAVTTCKFSQRKLETNIINYVLESMAPLSTVEMPSFRMMFDDLNIKQQNKTLKHMSRNTLCRRIDDLYEEKMQEVRSSLRKEAIYVCTTADIWTSRSRRFVGVTAHWIDSAMLTRKSVAIACRRFPGTHSAERIADVLIDINVSFGLDSSKIVATVTDNGSNFVKAFREFGVNSLDSFLCDTNASDDEDGFLAVNRSSTAESTIRNDEEVALQDDHAIYDDSTSLISLPNHLRCASHTLNLIAAVDTLKIIKSSIHLSSKHFAIITKCTAVWSALRSPKSYEVLQEHLGIVLPRPVVTRWNSLYDALERIVAFKEQIVQVSPLIGITDIFTDNDFRYIEEYLRILKPLAMTIDLLQGESFCHYGYLLPSLVSLRRKLNALHESISDTSTRFVPLINGIIKSLEDRFHRFFAVEDEVVGSAIAAVSHPRFKSRWLVSLPDLMRRRVENLFLRAATEEYRKGGQTSPEVNVRDPQGDDFFDFGEDTQTTMPIASGTVSVEIAKYMACPSTDLDMLKEFPTIRKLFIKFNTPLPSSAPVERLFSFATMMNLPKWNRLTDDHFEKRVLMKANAVKALSNANPR